MFIFHVWPSHCKIIPKTQSLSLNEKKNGLDLFSCTKICSFCHCKWFSGCEATIANPIENWTCEPALDLIQSHVFLFFFFCTALSIFFQRLPGVITRDADRPSPGLFVCWAGQDRGDNTSAIMAMSVVFWGSELWEREEVQRRRTCHTVCRVDGFLPMQKRGGIQSSFFLLWNSPD